MATRQISEVAHHLRRAVLLRDGAGLTDGQLLGDYLVRRDPSALAALVRRHGPMVWGVCRRVLRSLPDAEDAFQATFLVLVRKAASIVPREMVANWLHGVAHRTALKARATAARRGMRERQVVQMPQPAVAAPDLWRDLQPLFDEELSRLSAKYHSVIVLCDLEGKTRKEAARQLGVPEGTIGGWLARARSALAKRLTQRGVALSGGALAVVLAQNVASASVPQTVMSATIKAASVYAAGPATAGVISVKAAALTEGVLKSMLLTKLKLATAVLLGVFACAAVGAVAILPSAAGQPETKATALTAADDDKKTDKDKLQGEWVPVSVELKGNVIDFADEKVQQKLTTHFGFWKLTFDGDKVTPGEGEKVPYKLAADKKPKEVDIELGGNVGTMEAIYELDGDKLKLCWARKGGRPADFENGKTGGIYVELEKQKKK